MICSCYCHTTRSLIQITSDGHINSVNSENGKSYWFGDCGRALDPEWRGPWFDPHWHGVMFLSKTH